ncbi:Pectinesterase 1 [Hibiscus syriacus]|uniref:Pectinesterase n=1 Tax=Hibiscus syriacus TaxID=106335 RepID=A0A6A3CXN9_HIBSY|nr:Pectinesterase 1 [Hibiscus syriacus]
MAPFSHFEKITINRTKNFVTFFGDPLDMPKIEFNGTAVEFVTLNSATVVVDSDYFVANSAPMSDGQKVLVQAVAIRISGNKEPSITASSIGFQDTLYDDRGMYFFKDYYIEGTIDFIFGNGKSLYLATRGSTPSKFVRIDRLHHKICYVVFAATYSASVVDIATTDCNFETQLTAPPTTLNTYPVVPLMYLKILFTVLQCSLPGFTMYRLTTPITCAMSGLVHIIANIKLPTTDAYNTRDISILSYSLLGLQFLLASPSSIVKHLSCLLPPRMLMAHRPLLKASMQYFLL